MRLQAPAKINLHLRVGPPGKDGFHPLLSWMCAVGLFDNLEIEPAPKPGVFLSCDRDVPPSDGTNLIVRAANALAELAGVKPALRIRLEKNIPVGGGLGGGSSDAARTIQGLCAFWGVHLTAEGISNLAVRLGSDVPFFLHGPSSVCTGRGEIVSPIPPPRPRWVVLVLPELATSTAEVYRQFDKMRLGYTQAVQAQPEWITWVTIPAANLLPKLINDLEPAAMALWPSLARLRSDLEQSLGRIVRMSGSGSSLFTLADEQTEADRLAKAVLDLHRTPARAVELAPAWSDDLKI